MDKFYIYIETYDEGEEFDFTPHDSLELAVQAARNISKSDHVLIYRFRNNLPEIVAERKFGKGWTYAG